MAYAPPQHGFRTFVIVWLAQSLSVIGSDMTGFALNVYLAPVLYSAPEQKAELALAFTLLNLGFTIPFVFGGPVAGAWADRHDRRLIMIITNTASGLTSLLTFILMLAGYLEVWMLVCIGIVALPAALFTLLRSTPPMPCWYQTRQWYDADHVVVGGDHLASACGRYHRAALTSLAQSCSLRVVSAEGRHGPRHCHRCCHLPSVCGGAGHSSDTVSDAKRSLHEWAKQTEPVG